MNKIGPAQGQIWVYTFKEGLLSGLAHDLKIRVDQFTIDFDETSTLRATLSPSSFKVLCAVNQGREDYGALSPKDLRQCQANMLHDVLKSDKFPEIAFASTSVLADRTGFQIRGDLTLQGHTKPLVFHLEQAGSKLSAEIVINQLHFGLKPFSAAFGAIKLKPEIKIVIKLETN